jgi:hypothetical protein
MTDVWNWLKFRANYFVLTAATVVSLILLFHNTEQLSHLFALSGVMTCLIVALFVCAFAFVVWGPRLDPLYSAGLVLLIAAAFISWHSSNLVDEAPAASAFADVPFLRGNIYAAGLMVVILGIHYVYSRIHGTPMPTYDMFVRLSVVTFVLGLAGEALWHFDYRWIGHAPRPYSVGALCYVAFLTLSAVSVWETWRLGTTQIPPIANGRATPRFVRILFLGCVGAAFVFAFGSPQVGRKVVDHTPGRDAATDDATGWLKHLLTRLETIKDPDEPIVFVAASGGGSRAAVFTALIFEDLQQHPVTYQCQHDSRKRSFDASSHMAIISSVSGGSLASACYVDEDYRNSLDQRRPAGQCPRNFDATTVLTRIRQQLGILQEDVAFKEAHPNIHDVALAFDSATSWDFADSLFVDDMCADFMRPLLRGALYPGRERGVAVSRFWEQTFSLRRTNLERKSNLARSRSAPLLLCNATEVIAGKVLVLGYPELSQGLVVTDDADPSVRAPNVEEHRATHVPIEGLVDIDSDAYCSLTLAEMVRLSANFPWGFRVATLPLTRQRRHLAPAAVQAIDGGVFDNTGVTSLRAVLGQLERLSAPSSARSPLAKDAAKVLDLLRRHGVLLLEIDSGAKQGEPDTIAKRLGFLVEPVTAFTNTSYSTAAYLQEYNTNAMRSVLESPASRQLKRQLVKLAAKAGQRQIQERGDRLADSESVARFYHVAAVCNERDNVMTAWALSDDDIASVVVRFLVARDDVRAKIARVLTTHGDVVHYTRRLEEIAGLLSTDPASASGAHDEEYEGLVSQCIDDYVALRRSVDNVRLETTLDRESDRLYAKGGSQAQLELVSAKKNTLNGRRAAIVPGVPALPVKGAKRDNAGSTQSLKIGLEALKNDVQDLSIDAYDRALRLP